jgi:Tol biopolymer transport system component
MGTAPQPGKIKRPLLVLAGGAEALAELERVLSSKLFSRSRRHAAILSYLVHTTVEGRGSEISEYSIGQEACARNANFAPDVDATVRAEVLRLRARLQTYYATEGHDSAMEISLPAGYVPRFERRPAFHSGEAASGDQYSGALVANLNAQPQNASIGPQTDAIAPATTQAPPASVSRKVQLWIAFGAVVFVASLLFILLLGRPFRPAGYQRSLITWYPGSETEPALSPRGDRVAFAWDGETNENTDIYVKPLLGSLLVRLTTDPAFDHSPAWSPDGRNIAFLRRLPDRRQAVYVVPAEGGPERKVGEILTQVSGICWTPDSRWLIVPDSPRSVPLALFLLSVTTGERRKITDYLSFFHPAVSPDGRTLAFIGELTTPALFSLRLGKNSLPEGPVSRLPGAGIPGMRWPKWAHDGRSLFFSARDGIGRGYRYSLGSHRIQPIQQLDDGIETVEELPDGSGLLATRGKGHLSIVRVPPAPGANPAWESPVSSEDEDPSISPDGQSLAFLSMHGTVFSLWVSDLMRHRAKLIFSAAPDQPHPRWSPDSTAIVFTARKDARPDGRLAMFRFSLGSGKVEELYVNDSDNSHPTYSSDGRWIYFISNVSGSPGIWKAPATGGAPILVASAAADYIEESMDGQALFYHGYSSSSIYRL